MSESQAYELVALDRPLTPTQMVLDLVSETREPEDDFTSGVSLAALAPVRIVADPANIPQNIVQAANSLVAQWNAGAAGGQTPAPPTSCPEPACPNCTR